MERKILSLPSSCLSLRAKIFILVIVTTTSINNMLKSFFLGSPGFSCSYCSQLGVGYPFTTKSCEDLEMLLHLYLQVNFLSDSPSPPPSSPSLVHCALETSGGL